MKRKTWLETKEYSGKIEILDRPIQIQLPKRRSEAYTDEFITGIRMDLKLNIIFN